jgi:hypothetical protein
LVTSYSSFSFTFLMFLTSFSFILVLLVWDLFFLVQAWPFLGSLTDPYLSSPSPTTFFWDPFLVPLHRFLSWQATRSFSFCVSFFTRTLHPSSAFYCSLSCRFALASCCLCKFATLMNSFLFLFVLSPFAPVRTSAKRKIQLSRQLEC